MIFEKTLPFIYMALPFCYMSLKPRSKLPFKMNAWNNDEGKLAKDVNGINPEVRSNRELCSKTSQLGRAGAGIRNFYPHITP